MTKPVLSTPDQVETIRNRAKLTGWIQGGAVTAAGFIAWNLLGWIPVVALFGVVGFGAYRLAKRRKV